MPGHDEDPVVLSVVAPVHNEAGSLAEFHRRVSDVVDALGVEAEIVYVDDGSTDGSWDVIRGLGGIARRIRFSRNFGKEAALSAGLDVSRGQAIVVIDTDLQHPPELIAEMLRRWRAGADVVGAARTDRAGDGWVRRFASHGFYRVFNLLSDQPIPKGVSDFRLMDRRVVRVVQLMPERSRFMKAMLTWPGFGVDVVEFDVAQRRSGRSGFPLLRLWRFGLEGLFSYSSKPLQVWIYLGAMAFLAALVLLAWTVVEYLMWGASISGYRTVIAVVVGLAGVQITGLGVLGEYMARVFTEVKARPLYVVSEADVVPVIQERAMPRPELATFPRPVDRPAPRP